MTSPASNCFTVTRFGDVVPGITLRLVRNGEPYTPNIQVGDSWVERAQIGGFDFVRSDDGATGTVYRAMAQRISQNGERPVYVLGDVRTAVADKVLVRVSVRNPMLKSLSVLGRDLRLSAGTMGGHMILTDGMEKFVEVRNGESLLVFFDDGWVRAFSVESSAMVEISLTNEDMVVHRINDMLSSLGEEESRWGGPRMPVLRVLIAKMIDLFRLTARYANPEGQDLRMKLISEFFLKVTPSTMGLMSRALYSAVKDTDHVLLPMVEGLGYEELPAGVASFSDARQKRAIKEANLTPEERDAKRAENIRIAEEQRAAKKAKQAQFKAERKSRVQPKPQEDKKSNKKQHKKHGNGEAEERKRA